MGKKLRLLCTALCLFAFAFTAFAQETTGGVRGTVKDPQGAVVAGATVTVAGSALIGKRTAKTDSGGNYKIDSLPPGTYEISVVAQGFGTQTQQGLRIETGALPTINFDMKVGSENQTIEVSDEAVAVDVTQSKVQTNVTAEILQAIPRGRSFQSVIPFAPGARQEPLQGTTSGRNNGFQIDGASDSENVYMIDGINTTNIQNGGVGKNFQDDFTQEVQIKSSSFEAEFGGALGGVINAVPKRGSNKWHGEFKAYWQSSNLNANDPCATGFTSGGAGSLALTNAFSTTCGLRIDPTKLQLNTSNAPKTTPGLGTQGPRQDGTPEYYVPKKDDRHILEPGFEIGGPIMTDRLWLYSAYLPTLDTIKRTTTFTGLNSGPRTLTNTFVQHNMYNRLDYRALNQLRLFGSWNYAYSRTEGLLGVPDSAYGQKNTGASTDPSTIRADRGSVNPLSLYSFGGDWTPTSKLLVSARYGYFFSNTGTRGTPFGIRRIYDNDLLAGTTGQDGTPVPASAVNSAGFTNMPSNFKTFFDAFKRKSWNVDGSYFVGNLMGSHTFKVGYFRQTQANDVLVTAQTAVVNFDWDRKYTPVTSTTACAAIEATSPTGECRGNYGYFFVGSTTVSNDGSVNATDQAIYVQDSWTVGRTGLTINAGVRLDQENNPAYDPKRFPDLNFGWGDKIAPRIGGAYDVLHNGKVKAYASYGKFFDIMKLGLTRGSFGSDYWHQCVYALDTTNINSINPTLDTGAGCPATGPAPGVTARFIENVDFRATKADPRDPAIQPSMKPVQNHEFVAGVDWAISPTLTLETRYSMKRLDNTIEDMAITDDLGFYIGNPGSAFSDLLHRPTSIPCDPTGTPGFTCTPDAAGNYLNPTPFCAECPAANLKAQRRYDGVEFRLTKRSGNRWYGSVSYTYSQLRGNYAGLTNTDPTDGGGGRHSPNNGRAFDIPTMSYNPSGSPDDGPLATDRPHTAKIFGYYRLPWWGQETLIGVSQALYQGTPISACLPVVGSSSACQWDGGRGTMTRYVRNANGSISANGVVDNARTEPYFQTDLNIRHEFKLNKQRENLRLAFEGTASNLLNQRAAVGYYQFIIPTNLVSPSRAPRFSGDPGVDWNLIMSGYNTLDALNATGPFAGKQGVLTLASRYGMPQIFQTARQFRFAVRFIF
jgi:hypothetical protein